MLFLAGYDECHTGIEVDNHRGELIVFIMYVIKNEKFLMSKWEEWGIFNIGVWIEL